MNSLIAILNSKFNTMVQDEIWEFKRRQDIPHNFFKYFDLIEQDDYSYRYSKSVDPEKLEHARKIMSAPGYEMMEDEWRQVKRYERSFNIEIFGEEYEIIVVGKSHNLSISVNRELLFSMKEDKIITSPYSGQVFNEVAKGLLDKMGGGAHFQLLKNSSVDPIRVRNNDSKSKESEKSFQIKQVTPASEDDDFMDFVAGAMVATALMSDSDVGSISDSGSSDSYDYGD